MAVKEDSAHAPLAIHDEKMGYMDAEMGIDAYMDMDAHRDLD
jgi:predicted solute-binding protein